MRLQVLAQNRGPALPVSIGARKGTTTLEFACVAPIFFLLVLGIIELGRGLMVAQLLNHAARVGCRTAIVGNSSSSQIQTLVTNTLTGFGINGDTVTVAVNDSTGTALTTSTPSGQEITVSVSVPVSAITWIPGGGYLTGSISGQSTMRKE